MAWSATRTTAVKPVVKLTLMLSGGSWPSTSVTALAMMVSVQESPRAKSTSGLIANVVGPPENAAICKPLIEQTIVNHVPVTLTGSLNGTAMFWSRATFVVPFVGTVLTTVGASSTIVSVGGGVG